MVFSYGDPQRQLVHLGQFPEPSYHAMYVPWVHFNLEKIFHDMEQ